MNRLVILADTRTVAARILLPSLLHDVSQRRDMVCAAILAVPTVQGSSLWQHRIGRARRRLQALLGSGRCGTAVDIPPLDLTQLARQHACHVQQIPGGNPNHPQSISLIRNRFAANLALNLYSKVILKREFLDSFDMAVNYHNGSLPGYRGLRASNWSLYMDARTSGYAFHRIDAEVDAGHLLATGEVPVAMTDTASDLEVKKARDACKIIPALLDKMANREPGWPQQGIAGLHNQTAYLLATRVEYPSSLTSNEWQRRLRAFLCIHTHLEGDWWPVTGIAPCPGPGHMRFRSADGAWLQIRTLDFWPRWAWHRKPERQ